MSTASVRILVWGDARTRPFHFARTRRALQHAKLEPEERRLSSPADWAAVLAEATSPMWLLRAGCWTARPLAFPAASATGRPLCALGVLRPAPRAEADDSGEAAWWTEALAATGGDLTRLLRRGDLHSSPASVLLDASLARRMAGRFEGDGDMADALAAAAREGRARVVRYEPLDVHDGRGLRVAQVVTSLQRGGAERAALDLATELPRRGVATRLIALGGPTRRPFPAPPGAIDLSWERLPDRRARAARLLDEVLAFGADVAHAHLLECGDATRLAAGGPPLVLTVHNVRPGWAEGTEALRAGDASLLVACAQAVEADLRAAGVPIPVRTVWNGIDAEAFRPTPERLAEARAMRERLGLGANDFVLLAVANPRPQKRLHLLPAILEAARERFGHRAIPREARLLVAGQASGGSLVAQRAAEELRAEIEAHGLSAHTHLLGAVDETAPLFLAADALVSPSAYEGLSLAHLEALAAGRPVIASAVGGTPEAARENRGLRLVAPDAPAETYAEALVELAESETAPQLASHFTCARMAEGYARLYAGALAVQASGRRSAGGLLLVTNNFSTGGAQASARRLLLGLHAEGVPVRAVVIEEQPAFPTPGRRALVAAGVPVPAVPPPGAIDAHEAVLHILEAIEAAAPDAVVLWNVIAEYKLLLADALLDVPVYDVSPGEMYYAALERYFATPRPGLPYRDAREYGARLAGVIVKYGAAAPCAAAKLAAPVHVIPNGVACANEPAQRPKGAPVIIGTAARLDPRKKVHELIDAVRLAHDRLPPYILRIAGGVERGADDYARDLLGRARGLNVEWRGEIQDGPSFLHGLDLFALIAEPAGCPNASLEAMAQGLPVVATDVGGMSEQIVDGVTGRLVPAADPAALADSLLLLAHDAQIRARMGAAGLTRVRERFDVSRMVADYRRICLHH